MKTIRLEIDIDPKEFEGMSANQVQTMLEIKVKGYVPAAVQQVMGLVGHPCLRCGRQCMETTCTMHNCDHKCDKFNMHVRISGARESQKGVYELPFNATLGEIAAIVSQQSGYGTKTWEIRNVDGAILQPFWTPQQLGFKEGSRIYLSTPITKQL